LKPAEFDPLAYIENAFLDAKTPESAPTDEKKPAKEGSGPRFRKTRMSAPRPRRTAQPAARSAIDPDLQEVLALLPRNLEFLTTFFDDSVTANYYGGDFAESRHELVRRLLDPELTLEETSRLLGTCPATVRRYTNRGWLAHHRTPGGQRRFRLSDVVRFVEQHGRFPDSQG
jgi:excisionase family DNA binding protein